MESRSQCRGSGSQPSLPAFTHSAPHDVTLQFSSRSGSHALNQSCQVTLTMYGRLGVFSSETQHCHGSQQAHASVYQSVLSLSSYFMWPRPLTTQAHTLHLSPTERGWHSHFGRVSDAADSSCAGTHKQRNILFKNLMKSTHRAR